MAFFCHCLFVFLSGRKKFFFTKVKELYSPLPKQKSCCLGVVVSSGFYDFFGDLEMKTKQTKESCLFRLGSVYFTPEAQEALRQADLAPSYLLELHATGDWGDLSQEDKAANDEAVKLGGRILSAYNLPDGDAVWIITEADRKKTTILLPDQY